MNNFKKTRIIFVLLLANLIFIQRDLFAQGENITVTQVAQRTDGSGYVDIFYDLAGSSPLYFMSLEVSFNNGSTYVAVPSTYPSESNGVTPGLNRHLVWNGFLSNNNTFSTQTKVKLTAHTSIPCGQPFTDIRDGKVYGTVQIGSQCWMKQNLNTGTMVNGYQNQANNQVIEKYCYANHEYNCDEYGGLYQWNEMMQYNLTPKIRGICPYGWLLPSIAEWTTLTTYLGGDTIAGGLMKEEGTAHWISPNNSATNESGFTALPGGLRYTYDIGFALWHS
ncbi:MAG: FISUMP domain-containing protein, partial [Bacteroidales bacterium]